MSTSDICILIEKDSFCLNILKEVEKLDLSDWWIGAGFVRGRVWDYLHGYKKSTELPDIDIIYFDKNGKKDEEKIIWKKLKNKFPAYKWSVTNTAFRHLKTKTTPYISSTDCISHWVETATCVGVSLKNGKVILTAPHGVSDLTGLIIRPTYDWKDKKEMKKRIKEKKWLEKWPKLQVTV